MSRKMNAEIAAKVMGWKTDTYPENWNPTKDLTQAYLILKKLRKFEPDIIIYWFQEQSVWAVNVGGLGAYNDRSLSKAICGATLTWLEQYEG